MKLTRKEEQYYADVQALWAIRKATSKQILKALAIARKAGA